MKRWLISISCLFILIIGFSLFISKAYYPTLPVKSISKRSALATINDSTESIVKLTEENGYEWFMTRKEKGQGYKNLKMLMNENGWVFQGQEGSGYFFKKGEQ
ncbi:hypothetical protein [Metabacillus malikii]|uniref:Ribosome biogenesis GTPase RsgA n=1 Tax=Metabacillus malikii TaxID=1504265 RepID=A0ABT9ZE73_9BACI|nr:hypothetical protein [Metabacillus malikii]MDQ0230121.1 putative ribosome biogenesis GTPase RsgA [Metabacillus malikii]